MLNGKPVVILDCDDVVCRCLHGMSKEMNAKLGTNVTEDDVLTWDFHDTFGPETKEYVHSKMAEKGWCANLEPFAGAVEGVTKLKEIAEIFFCTAPYKSEHWPHERRIWLQTHFQMEPWRVIQSSSKFLVRGELFVDDKVEHLVEWEKYGRENGMGGRAVLWDRPHNKLHPGAGGFLRIGSWEQLYTFVRRWC
jgi:5'(3')-deoxyribonucleotidase